MNNTIIYLLRDFDPKRFPSLSVAKRKVKAGWVGVMKSPDGCLLFPILDPKYIPVPGQELSLFDGMYGCEARYTVVTEGIALKLIEH